MKKLFFMLIAFAVVAGAQTPLTKDYMGNFTVTALKAVSSHLTDTSGTFVMPSEITGFMIQTVVDTGKTSFVIQAAPVYSATQTAMAWVTIDSVVGATSATVKSFAGSYGYIRVIRSRWTGGTTKWGCYSACYLKPYGASK